MNTKTLICGLGIAIVSAITPALGKQSTNRITPPAYPLVTIDPYTSIWSNTDNLYGSATIHWTGKEFPLVGVAKVDDAIYRFMGIEDVDLTPVVTTADNGKWDCTYTMERPADDWMTPTFDDSSWKKGQGCFGTKNEKTAGTFWKGGNVWVRRTIETPAIDKDETLYLLYSNDDIATFYINGVKVFSTNEVHHNANVALDAAATAALKVGRNVISATCEDKGGLAVLDFGLAVKKEGEKFVLPNTARQISADVQATQTHYNFVCGPIDLRVTFTAPLLMNDLELLSRPVNYISYKASSNDGRKHDVSIYFEASPRIALDFPFQDSMSEIVNDGNMVYVKSGSVSQQILQKKGDDRRIDWGYFYMAGDNGSTVAGIGKASALRSCFVQGGDISSVGSKGGNASGRMALVQDLGKIKKADGYVLIGYDDIYSIQYFGKNLRPYWNKNGDKSIFDAFNSAAMEYSSLIKRCDSFDRELMLDAEKAGGRKYAELCALAYRQAIHAHKLVEAPNGDILWFSKENNSNGSIGTVDITYPSAPLFLLYNPKLAEGLMNHIYYYSESGRWTKPFPAHDVGTYPIANGQTYGGDMPVEEAGNMIILTAALCHYEKDATYAAKHWETLTTWTEYLEKFGLDPESQLCTDDFAGHFAHNANLSIKAILGIASYGYLAKMLGKDELAEDYTHKARALAKEWMRMADDGDHYRLTFDKPGTWSQKYNLVWDKLLGLDIFPKDVARKELAYYPKVQNTWGLPLDSRKTYTKTDWIVWTATLADNMDEFQTLVTPVWKFMDETEDRVPMSDWVFTDRPVHKGFKARSVVGGYFIKMLENLK